MHFIKVTAILATLAATAEAAKGKSTFAVNRFYGKGPLTSGRMDPIVNPGAPSSHVHAIQGGNAFALDMTDDQPLKSSCTSSKVKNDFSNYWTPQLYFKDPKSGKLTSVEFFYQNVYYFFDASEEEVHPFPVGLRMFVGNASQRTPPQSPTNVLDKSKGTPQPIQWTCPRSKTAKSTQLYPPGSDGLHGVGIQDPTNGGQGIGFSDKECDGYASPLRADIHFPSCYNPAKGLRNYKENMDWPTDGKCPEGFLHVPHLFYEIYWNTPKFDGQWTPGQGESPWVLSNGDPTGYSLHGDFIAGWDTKTLQQIIDNCDAGDAGMDKCPGLIGGLNDDSDSCTIENLVPETIFGTLDALPGGNKIGAWGVPGTDSTPAAPAASPGSALSPSNAAGAPASVMSPAINAAGGNSPGHAENPSSASEVPAPTNAPQSGYGAIAEPGSGTTITSYVSETPAAPAAGSSVSEASVPGWSYKGCFSDARDERVLSGVNLANVGRGQVSNSKCTAYCEARGFSMAGTEYGGQCFCGNELSESVSISEDECSMKCEGDNNQTCGGSLALSLYEKTGSSKTKRIIRHMHRHLAGISE